MLEPPFLLYKYRSLESLDSDEFAHVKDILCKGQFYAASFRRLNDPMEGLFTAEDGLDETRRKELEDCKQGLLVCALSKSCDNPLLWVNYADRCRGICIEVQVRRTPDYDKDGFELAEVKYPMKRPYLDRNTRRGSDAHAFAQHALSRKWKEWKVEKEVRILSRRDFVPIEPSMKMTRILLGKDILPELRTAIEELTPPEVKIWTTRIGPIRQMDILEPYEQVR